MSSPSLVIGASGYLGAEIYRQCSTEKFGTYLHNAAPGCARYDFFSDHVFPFVSLQKKLRSVIFASAVEKLPTDEVVYQQAVQQFVRNIARSQLRLVYVSSDAVFSGDQGQYCESDASDATTFYGRRLRYFEDAIRASLQDYVILRVSYLFGDTASHQDRRMQEARACANSGKVFYRYSNVFKSPLAVDRAAELCVQMTESRFTGTLHGAAPRHSLFDFFAQNFKSVPELRAALQPRTARREEVDGLDTSLVSQFPLHELEANFGTK